MEINNKSIKIAYDAKRAYHNSSGLGNYSRDLIRMMSKRLPNALLFTLNPKPSQRKPFSTDNIIEIRPKWKTFGTFWRLFKAYKVAHKHNANIFHGLSNELPLGYSFDIKKVVTIHDVIFLRHPEWYKKADIKIYTSKTIKACKNADLIIAISEQTKSDLVEFLNVPSNKIQVIYQTCHPAFLKSYSTEELDSIREKYNLPTQFMLNVGTIEPRKNVKLILKAMKHVDQIPLVAIGRKTEYYDSLEAYAKVRQLTDRFLTPQVDSMEDLAKIYQLATMFIYPSKFEGFGIPIIEALFSNIPVITNKEGVFPEAGGPRSYYVDLDDTKDLVSKINYILENPDQVKLACKESRTFAEKFTESVLADQWNNTYTQLLNR